MNNAAAAAAYVRDVIVRMCVCVCDWWCKQRLHIIESTQNSASGTTETTLARAKVQSVVQSLAMKTGFIDLGFCVYVFVCVC